MGRYCQDIKDKLFEEWYSQGQPPINRFYNYLKDNEVARKTIGLIILPNEGTIDAWRHRYNWVGRAEERDRKIAETFQSRAEELKKSFFNALCRSSMAQIDALQQVIEAANLDSLTPEEARKLLPEARELGNNAVRHLKEALVMAGVGGEYTNDKPDLNTVFTMLDRTLGIGGELKLAIAAKVNRTGSDQPLLEDEEHAVDEVELDGPETD